MPTVSRHYADFAGNIVIGASGVANVNFPTTCNALMLYLGTAIGDPYFVMLNYEDPSQGPDSSWDKTAVQLPAGIVLTIPDYEIDSVQVTSSMGSTFSYWGFVTPGGAPSVTYTYERT